MTHVTEIMTSQHVKDMLVLGKACRDECGGHIPFDPLWTSTWLASVMSDLDRTFTNVFIAYTSELPIGFLIGHATPYAFSSAISAQQEVWYVEPEYRGTRAAFKLIQAFEEWARLRGAIEIFTGVAMSDTTTVDKITSVLKRMGYPQVGTHHKKRTV